MRATRIITNTITVQERAANVMSSTTLVAAELEPNVCVMKSKLVHTDVILTPHKDFTFILDISTTS